MQEAPTAQAAPTGFLNKFTWLGMILAGLAGCGLCAFGVQQSDELMSSGSARLILPSRYRLSGAVATRGTMAGQSNDVLRGSIQGNISGSGDGTIRGDISGSVNGSIYGRDDRFNGSLDGRANGDIRGSLNNSFDGRVSGQMQSSTLSQFGGSTENSGTISGDITPEIGYNTIVYLDKPGRPWQRAAFVLLAAAALAQLRRIFQIIRRRKSAIESTPLVAKLMAAGGLVFFAGADGDGEVHFLGLWLIAYAGVGYLTYTRWERIRAQFYKD